MRQRKRNALALGPPERARSLARGISKSGEHMADDLNEFDDPEQSYRRGYVHGAREVLAAIERRLPADHRAMIETWLEGDLSKWRVENLRGKTGRNKTGLTGNMGPPRLLILD
jgi:hypothetical protein